MNYEEHTGGRLEMIHQENGDWGSIPECRSRRKGFGGDGADKSGRRQWRKVFKVAPGRSALRGGDDGSASAVEKEAEEEEGVPRTLLLLFIGVEGCDS